VRNIILALLIVFVFTAIYSYIFYIKSYKSGNDLTSAGVGIQLIPEDNLKNNTPKRTTVMLGGDVMIGRNVMGTSLDKVDYLYPFRGIADHLAQADIAFINLENPIIKNCPRHDGGFIFCAVEEMAEGLVFSGINIVSLANNHSLNYGREGLMHTVSFLNSLDISSTGVDNLVMKEVNGVKFGFLGFDRAQQLRPQLTLKDWELVENSSGIVDVLIVAMHWGVEYEDTALPGVKRLGAELVKRGADVVVGHHPHWVQDLECFANNNEGEWFMVKSISKQEVVGGVTCPQNSKPVYYSLGNLVFDQMWSEETKKGLIVELLFEENIIVEAKHHNTYMSSWAQPEIVR
jgi:poly-gamma-glutamate capsule biosynthesis protein CapA/YwtB (metallophosphatase superfamily)